MIAAKKIKEKFKDLLHKLDKGKKEIRRRGSRQNIDESIPKTGRIAQNSSS